MFSIFTPNPVKKLHKSYGIKLEEAMLAQRKGDIHTYSFLTAEAEEIYKQIQALEAQHKE